MRAEESVHQPRSTPPAPQGRDWAAAIVGHLALILAAASLILVMTMRGRSAPHGLDVALGLLLSALFLGQLILTRRAAGGRTVTIGLAFAAGASMLTALGWRASPTVPFTALMIVGSLGYIAAIYFLIRAVILGRRTG